jgi:hypothetical protein
VVVVGIGMNGGVGQASGIGMGWEGAGDAVA